MDFMFNLAIFKPIVASSLTDYFFQSNAAGQVIVIVLLGFSLLAWGAMFCKKADLSEMEKLNEISARVARNSNSIADATMNRNLKGPYAALMRDAITALENSGAAMSLSSDDKNSAMTFVDNALQRSLSRQLMKYESKMILLGTTISGAPFLGLLGTAWGVMDCFGSMSAQTSVTLQQLAPGVAGALLTTVAGLCVAIPAVFGYNYLTSIARRLSTETENFASMLSDRIEMETRTSAAYRARYESASRQSFAAQSQQLQQPVQPVPTQPVVQQAQQYSPTPAQVVQPTPHVRDNAKVVDFSFDDDDASDSPTPQRDFDD